MKQIVQSLVLSSVLALATSCPESHAQQGLAQAALAPPAPSQLSGKGLRAGSAVLTPDWRAVRNLDPPPQPPLPELGALTSATRFSYGSVVDLNPYVQIEMPRDLGEGRYSRPRVRLGMQSDTLKSFATSVGLQPERCTLPGLRARSSASSDELSASVMLFARCSFY